MLLSTYVLQRGFQVHPYIHKTKIPTKSLEYFGNHNISGNAVLYTIAKRVFLLYNATSFTTIASFRADILSLGGGKVEKEMYQIFAQQHKKHIGSNSTIQPNQYGILDDNFNVLLSPDLVHFLPDSITS